MRSKRQIGTPADERVLLKIMTAMDDAHLMVCQANNADFDVARLASPPALLGSAAEHSARLYNALLDARQSARALGAIRKAVETYPQKGRRRSRPPKGRRASRW